MTMVMMIVCLIVPVMLMGMMVVVPVAMLIVMGPASGVCAGKDAVGLTACTWLFTEQQ